MFEKKIKSLNDVFFDELGDLYSAEHQLIKALPKLVNASSSPLLIAAIEEHLEQTRRQANRLEEIFDDLGHDPQEVTCKAMKGLIEESEEVIHKSEKCAARDAALIGAAQRVEHYEIAAYGTAENHAAMLGHERVRGLLRETLEEEKQANFRLNEIAEDSVNFQAQASM